MPYTCEIATRSLYVHWPFCPYKCHFCPFVALASQDQFMEKYHDALVAEIEQFGALQPHKNSIDTVFLGGGTPSTYPDLLLLDMLGTLRRTFTISQDAEITIEVNPGTVRTEQISLWKEHGITRMSIGVQSLKDEVLRKLNRHQTVKDVYVLLEQAQHLFSHISVDLILGLPEVTEPEWKEMLASIVTWPINHISIYFLMVHEDTPLYFKVKDKRVVLPCDDGLVDLYYWTIDFLEKHGLHQYEISNFARDGYESRHNSMYWDRKPYKGFGLGACSFDGTSRFQNEKNLMKYIDGVHGEKDVTIFSETLSREQIHMEKVMLGIRRAQGVSLTEVMHDLSDHEQKAIQERIQWLTDNEFLYKQGERLKLTPRGLSVENEIALKLSI